MNNKVQVIFTFELKDHTEKSVQGGVNAMSLVHINVQSRGMDVSDEDDGPHIVYAHILKQNTPAIISFLNDEFKRAVRVIGCETQGLIHRVTSGGV